MIDIMQRITWDPLLYAFFFGFGRKKSLATGNVRAATTSFLSARLSHVLTIVRSVLLALRGSKPANGYTTFQHTALSSTALDTETRLLVYRARRLSTNSNTHWLASTRRWISQGLRRLSVSNTLPAYDPWYLVIIVQKSDIHKCHHVSIYPCQCSKRCVSTECI